MDRCQQPSKLSHRVTVSVLHRLIPGFLTLKTARSRRTPEGIIIRTPSPELGATPAPAPAPTAVCFILTPLNGQSILMDSLPFFQFNSILREKGIPDPRLH